jgi:alkylhydroperoxidase family enzyme
LLFAKRLGSVFRKPEQEVIVPRIQPLEPPFVEEVADQLTAMMPTGIPPIVLFRTLVKNVPMAKAMSIWGGYELGRTLSLTRRDREILIDRTCARCGCEYEWGVHVAFFAERVGLTLAQVTSLTHGRSDDFCWDDERDQMLIEVADQLHDESRITSDLWHSMSLHLSEQQQLDALLLCGWYHAISFVANGAEIELEIGAPRFADVAM